MKKYGKSYIHGNFIGTTQLAAFKILSETERIIPALESSHAIAFLIKNKEKFKDKTVVINLSGRGDKDVHTVAKMMGKEI